MKLIIYNFELKTCLPQQNNIYIIYYKGKRLKKYKILLMTNTTIYIVRVY